MKKLAFLSTLLILIGGITCVNADDSSREADALPKEEAGIVITKKTVRTFLLGAFSGVGCFVLLAGLLADRPVTWRDVETKVRRDGGYKQHDVKEELVPWLEARLRTQEWAALRDEMLSQQGGYCNSRQYNYLLHKLRPFFDR